MRPLCSGELLDHFLSGHIVAIVAIVACDHVWGDRSQHGFGGVRFASSLAMAPQETFLAKDEFCESIADHPGGAIRSCRQCAPLSKLPVRTGFRGMPVLSAQAHPFDVTCVTYRLELAVAHDLEQKCISGTRFLTFLSQEGCAPHLCWSERISPLVECPRARRGRAVCWPPEPTPRPSPRSRRTARAAHTGLEACA